MRNSILTVKLSYPGFAIILCAVLIHLSCSSPQSANTVRIRPSKFSEGDPILQPPSFSDVLHRFETMHENYFEKKHHQFHHRNSKDYNRFSGSYGLGYWDLRGADISISGNREETHFSTYPRAAVAGDIALAYLYAYDVTSDPKYLKLAKRILDNFLKHEQVRVLNADALLAEPMSLIGSFTDWVIRGEFPQGYQYAGLYVYKDTPDSLVSSFSGLRALSIPTVVPAEEVVFDSTGYNAALKVGSIIVYSGQSFPEPELNLNRPGPISTVKALLPYIEAIVNDYPGSERYIGIISEAVQGFYGFELRNRWDIPSIEVYARAMGSAAAVKALRKAGYSTIPGKPLLPLDEILHDALLRIRNVADPAFPGWFNGWTPGGPMPVRYNWWIIQAVPDFYGTDNIAGQRYPWFIQVYDNYGTNDDIQLWHFCRTLSGIAYFYPFISEDSDTLRMRLKDFLCQGFNYLLHFQCTDTIPSFKGGIDPDAYSISEFSMNQQDFTKFGSGDELEIKRYSNSYFKNEALTYPFPIGLQAAITTAMNIPELESELQGLINSGMNHLLACEVFYKSKLDHPELRYMQNWLAPEVFKTLALYLKYRKK
ncbi:hypothetical protein JXJ21_05335 [candidate division KSB1 bacterium]|nr:hypothetical protein [candidate division KSB1 bacterium]